MVEPRHHTPRSDFPTRGGAVAKIAAAKGKPLMPWQRQAVDVALEYDPATGLYRYGTIVVTVPRQSGKTELEGNLADHRCLTKRNARVWITMQNGKTVDSWMREEHFQRLRDARIFGEPGRAGARFQEVRRAGEVGVRWPALGSTFYTFPPKRDALHSKQADLALVDEAWAHNAETGADIRQAVRPTMATRPGAQLGVFSTMGDDSSVFFDSYVELGIASLSAPGSRVCIIDYGIGDDVDPEDLDAIAAAHPAYGHTIGMQALVDAREEFGADVAGWARAYGNRATRTRETAIPVAAWTAAGRPRPPVPARAGIALDATPSGHHYAVASGWRDETGDGWAEVLDHGTPRRDTPAMLAALAKRNDAPLVADRAAVGALEILDAVARESPDTEIRYLNMAEYASGCGTYHRGVLDDTVHHVNQPELTAAVEVAAKRDLGDGAFGWARKGSAGTIAELVAASNALKAFDLLPPPKRRAVARAGKRHH